MRILHDFADHGQQGQRAKTLAILLPGALQQPEEFVQAGFVAAVRQRGLPIDLALADLGIRYIGETTDGTALQRLHDEVILPARLHGYEEIWLAGISIGGFMAIAHADRHPSLVHALCLLAPYPGNRMVTNEIGAAGGIRQWRGDATAEDDAERRAWRWMKMHGRQPAAPRVHLGYGQEDRFAPGLRLMAEALPRDCVDAVPGGHDWPAWQRLWENFLDGAAARCAHRTTGTAS